MPVGVLGVCARPSVGFELHSPYRSHKDKKPKIIAWSGFQISPCMLFLISLSTGPYRINLPGWNADLVDYPWNIHEYSSLFPNTLFYGLQMTHTGG